METFTEDQQVIGAERWRAWEARDRQRDKANARKITLVASAAMMVLWLAGMITNTRLGGSIHILILVAVVALVIQVLRGRRSIL